MAAAVALGVLGAGSAQAQDGGLLSLLNGASTSLLGQSSVPLLNNPSVVLGCFPSGQTGVKNHFSGTQNINCTQSATQSNSGGNNGGGITGYEVVNAGSFNLAAGQQAVGVGFCPFGKRPLSGGVVIDGGAIQSLRLNYSAPGPDPREWLVGVTNEGATAVQGHFFVLCADVAS
ncbi:hypothetical protein ACWCV9_32580 [Streptomyces sp. NPDC001606]